MDYKDALELQIMFTIAAQKAKESNKIEIDYQLDEAVLVDFLKKAYPNLKSSDEITKLAQAII